MKTNKTSSQTVVAGEIIDIKTKNTTNRWSDEECKLTMAVKDNVRTNMPIRDQSDVTKTNLITVKQNEAKQTVIKREITSEEVRIKNIEKYKQNKYWRSVNELIVLFVFINFTLN